MSKLTWDAPGTRLYETGVDHGVLFPTRNGVYQTGVPWSGLTTVTESPSGAEPTPIYADNKKYLNLMSAEDFGFSIEALYYPDEWEECDGSAEIAPGISIGQQARKPFGFSYRSLLGNELEATEHGYKLHIVYGGLASPSERSRASVNETPEAATLSWDITTTAVDVPGFRATAHVTIDSTKTPASVMAAIESILYGTNGQDSRLPTPAELMALQQDAATVVAPAAPTFTPATGAIVIPTAPAGVEYRRVDTDVVVTGTVTVAAGKTLGIRALAKPGFAFIPDQDDYWSFTRPTA